MGRGKPEFLTVTIVVTVSPTIVTVKNSGLPLPIEKMPGTEVWLPQYIFGELRTSSNFEEEERHEIGQNGVGSKAANIFSTRFQITVENAVLGKKYVQVWENNMIKCNAPKITVYKGKTSHVTIEYLLDFKKFGYTEYPKEAFE